MHLAGIFEHFCDSYTHIHLLKVVRVNDYEKANWFYICGIEQFASGYYFEICGVFTYDWIL